MTGCSCKQSKQEHQARSREMSIATSSRQDNRTEIEIKYTTEELNHYVQNTTRGKVGTQRKGVHVLRARRDPHFKEGIPPLNFIFGPLVFPPWFS